MNFTSRRPPKLAPLMMAAVVLAVGVFLMNRIRPSGTVGKVQEDRPKVAKTLTFVPAVASNPKSDPVAWGEAGLLQIGLESPQRHDAEGPVWMMLHLRHNGPGPVGLSANLRGDDGSGRVMVKVLSAAGRIVEWPVQEVDLAFSLNIPAKDDVRIPFRFQEPSSGVAGRQTNTFTVSLSIRDATVRTDRGSVGPLDLETGGVVLNRYWTPGVSAGPKPRDTGDDGLGIRPGDIVIPVPSQGGK